MVLQDSILKPSVFRSLSEMTKKKKKKKDLLQTIWLKKDTQLKGMGTTVESNTVMGDVLVICELHPK